jgi:hypothetical protein
MQVYLRGRRYGHPCASASWSILTRVWGVNWASKAAMVAQKKPERQVLKTEQDPACNNV